MSETDNPRAPLLRPAPAEAPPADAERPQPQRRPAGETSVPALDPSPVVEAKPRARSSSTPLAAAPRLRWLPGALLCLGALLLLLLGAEMVALVQTLAAWHWLLALPVTLLAAGFAGFALLGALRELRQMRRLATLARLRAEGEALAADAGASDDSLRAGADYRQKIAALYGDRDDAALAAALVAVREQHQAHHSGADQVRLLSAGVGAELDRQALAAIARHVRQLAALVAVNPIALLDSLAAAWLTLRMIREVAEVYGGRPGLLASWRLVREVALLVTAAGAGDLAADSAGEALGAGLAGLLSAKLAQGAVTGLLLARVGLTTLRVCRPIPLGEDQDRLWQQLRRQVFAVFA